MLIVGPTLPEPYYSDVETVWDAIEAEFGDHGVSNPVPHFTLYGLDGAADIDALAAELETVLSDWDPFEVRTDGLGIFPGDHVWIPVAKSPHLTSLHEDVVAVAREFGTAPTPYYEPHRWFPHVALALGFESTRVGDVVRYLRTSDYDFERQFTVDNVEITYRPEGADEFERVASIPFDQSSRI